MIYKFNFKTSQSCTIFYMITKGVCMEKYYIHRSLDNHRRTSLIKNLMTSEQNNKDPYPSLIVYIQYININSVSPVLNDSKQNMKAFSQNADVREVVLNIIPFDVGFCGYVYGKQLPRRQLMTCVVCYGYKGTKLRKP